MKLKVTYSDGSQRVLSFSLSSKNVVVRKYGQLVSQGDIYDFQEVS